MKRLLLVAVISMTVLTAVSAAWYMSRLHRNSSEVAHIFSTDTFTGTAVTKKLNGLASAARQFVQVNHFNSTVCFLADMSIASGKPRFFVYDMKNNTVTMNGLVTHGRCNQNWLTGRKYGNAVGCGCTSLGKYRVAGSYKGRFGLAYKLNGLEATNSNAYNRFVVLHSMQCVPEKEVDPYPICQSDGCPTVSPGFLKELAVIIDGSKQPILLWIIE